MAVAKFGRCEILRYVDHQIYLLVMEQLQSLRLHVGLAWPVDAHGRNAVVIQEAVCAACGIDLEALVVKAVGSFKHVGFLLRRAC